MTCTRCHGSMREHHFYDLDKRHGFMWMKGWRCLTCGYAADPILEADRQLRRSDETVMPAADEQSRTMLSVPWRYGPMAFNKRGLS